MHDSPQRIVELLADRERHAGARQFAKLRLAILAVLLVVLMPLRLVLSGFRPGATFGFDLALIGVSLASAVILAWRLRRPCMPGALSCAGTLLDYGVLAAILAEHAVLTPGGSLVGTDQVYLFGYLLLAISVLRVSRRDVMLTAMGCVALLVELLVLDTMVRHMAFDGIRALILMLIAGAMTASAYAMVLKTRQLVVEAASMEAESLRVKGVLSRYVSAQVAEAVLQEDMALGAGQRRRVSLMFSDIRDFTRLSERMEPEEVLQLLNTYFGRMVGALFAHDGTLDKYMGDGLMAVFGAPVATEDHAWQAVQAAVQMRSELLELNRERAAAGLVPLAIGIGIHTGECIIGNLGTPQRSDYTAIGDVVNTASRIEGLTKLHGIDILLSADTFAEVQDRVVARRLPEATVRGKTAPLGLYALEGLPGPAEAPRTRLLSRRATAGSLLTPPSPEP